MLALTGPLVGLSFINAVRTYAEMSGLNGTASGAGEAFAPLDGIWAPTFSAYEIAATFLLPFVAIRLIAGDRQNGALALELQGRLSSWTRTLVKAATLLTGWLVASLGALAAIVLWKSYGGSSYAPEIVAVAAGHLLNALLTIALAAAAASLADHPATAAIVTLAATVGTWVVSFVAAVQGGIWERLAAYTPVAMVAEFQHGLIRADVVIVVAVLVLAGLGVSAVWLRLGVPIRRRVGESCGIAAVTAIAILGASRVGASWDVSESRRNSFSEADERALRQIPAALHIEAHLAPEDGRRVDLERRAFAKLRLARPDTTIAYISATSIGLFEQTAPQYGEIWYELGGRRVMSRLTTEEGVLETIYGLAGVTPVAGSDEAPFRGHPLAATPRGSALFFYGIWPAAVVAAAWRRERR
jgi:hypothetical protein